MRYTINIERIRALMKDNPDAECSDCRAIPKETKYWYILEGETWGTIQFCDKCAEKRGLIVWAK